GPASSSVGMNEQALKNLEEYLDKAKAKLAGNEAVKLIRLVQRLRNISVVSIAERFSTMVDDLSAQLNKSTSFEASGDGSLPPNYRDTMQDCLLHIIRNSLDHGLETPDERKSANKDPKGKIQLQATDESDFVKIVIRDDGRGIDGDRLAKKAAEKGF